MIRIDGNIESGLDFMSILLKLILHDIFHIFQTQGSPKSTPNSSPRSRSAHSPPLPAMRGSAPSTPGDSLVGMGGDAVRQAFGQSGSNGHRGDRDGSMTGSVRSLRNDLLVAADSVTNAMSSLVKELNSG